MAFNFPKDEELFEDLENIAERSADMEELDYAERAYILLEDDELHKDDEPFDDLEGFDACLDSLFSQENLLLFRKRICDKYYDSDTGRFEYDRYHKTGLFDETLFGPGFINKLSEVFSSSAKATYLSVEEFVFSYVSHRKIGFFPINIPLSIGDPEDNTTLYTYFPLMDQHFKFMKGIGKLGEVLDKAKKYLDVIGKPEQIAKNQKTNTAAPESSFSVALYFLLLGAVLVLAGGGGLLMIPDFLTRLFNSSLIARLILYIPVAVTGLFVMGMSKEIMGEEDSSYSLPMKLIGNGIVAIVVVIGSVLTLLSSLMIGEVSIEFMLLGVYYLLYGVCIVMDDAIRTSKAKEARAKLEQDIAQAEKEANLAKPEFRKLVEENIEYMHRYIRFHVLWWQSLHPKKSLPSGITSLQKSFDHLLAMYDKCK